MSAHKNGFLNVDLDITCPSGLDALLAALAENMILLVHYGDFASLETNTDHDNPSATIIDIAEIIESLDQPLRRVWDEAEKRILNVGVEASAVGAQHIVALSPVAIARVTRINAGIEFTIYNYAQD